MDRIDQYLEGRLDRAALGPDDRADADALERVVDETRQFVGARPAPDLSGPVLGRIERAGLSPTRNPGWTQIWRGLWTPREFSFAFRPAYGVVAAAIIVAVSSTAGRTPPGTQVPAAAIAGDPAMFVQFRLHAPDASTVGLAGSFTGWQPAHELYEVAPGIWTVTLALPPGVHDYAFVIDGERWVADPYAPGVRDGFGGTMSRVALLLPERSRL